MENTITKKAEIIQFYVLRCPIDGQVKYVGKTKRKLYDRLYRHITMGKGNVGVWVKSIIACGLKPKIEAIGSCDKDDDWEFYERLLISEYRNFGYKILNITDGGMGLCGYKMNDDQRKVISERSSVPVYSKNLLTGEIIKYKSFREASSITGISQSRITNCADRGCKSNGLLFSKTTEFTLKESSMKYMVPVVCIYPDGTEVEYKSSNAAGKALNLDPAFIRKVCAGKYSQYKGLKFKLKSE